MEHRIRSTASEPRAAGERPLPGVFGDPVSRETISRQAYQAIRTSLMRSRLRPGQKLIARDVARDLGISITPVREALLRLVAEHGLELDERGTVVVPVLDLERCLELRDLRILIEGEGAARAARRATRTEIDALKEIHRRYVQTEQSDDLATALAENENFHFALCRMAKSPALERIVQNLWMQFGPVLSYLYEGGGRPFHGRRHGHLIVIEALLKRDEEAARRAIGQDILIGGAAVLESLQAKPARRGVAGSRP